LSALVFIEPNKIDSVPFTTSLVVAEHTFIEHRKLKATIRKYENELKAFGLSAPYQAESTGGRPEEYYKLNEPQAVFLLTLLKNTEPVVRFKAELVRQFFLMRSELLRRQVLRMEHKPIRRSLTDAIRDAAHSQWDYKLYTDLIYKIVTGRTARQLRQDRGAKPDDTALDFMTAAEIEAVTALESKIAVLLECGMSYGEIKNVLLKKRTPSLERGVVNGYTA